MSDHRSAIETFDAASYSRVLQHNLASHEERVRLISRAIVELGGTTATGSVDELGLVRTAQPQIVSLVPLGMLATMDALALVEDRNRQMYLRAFETVDAATRPFLRWLLSEQCDTHITVLDLQAMVATAAAMPGQRHKF